MLGMLSRDGGTRGRELRTEVWSRGLDQKNGFLARDRSVTLHCTNSGAFSPQKNLETCPGIGPFMVIMVHTAVPRSGLASKKFLPVHRFWCNNSRPRIALANS